MNLIDKDLLRTNVGHAVLWFYVNNNGELTEESVVKCLETKMVITPEMRSYIGSMLREWVQHLERKKNEYVQKSKCVNWLTDATYDLEVR